MSLDASVIALVLNKPERLVNLLESGISTDSFSEDFKPLWLFILRMKKQHGDIPSRALMQSRFPDVYWPAVRSKDLPILVHQLQARQRMNNFLAIMMDASKQLSDPDDLPDVMSYLQSGINQLQMQNGDSAHLVDMLGADYQLRIIEEIKHRRKTANEGLKTGLTTFDHLTGGLQPQRLIAIIARTSHAKSWLNLLFVVEAIRCGKKVILYPLEMSLEETAFRLYTIFSQKMYAGSRTLSNMDLSMGRVNKSKFLQLLSILEDNFAGKLMVADIGNSSEAYTLERIEADVEVYKPDLAWVDYLTLMKSPDKKAEGWQNISTLGKGLKGIAMRHQMVVGCSAQVSREHLKSRSLCPRLEHISFGDALGHDCDVVFSLHKQRDRLWYALVKNRGGPEIDRVACRLVLDQGIIEETQDDKEPETNG